eukprot:g2534.t1
MPLPQWLRNVNWRGAWLSLDREVAINIASSIGLIDDRHMALSSGTHRSPSIMGWAEVEKLIAISMLCLAIFMEFIATGVTFPALVYYARSLGADSFEAGVVMGVTMGTVGACAKYQRRFFNAFGVRPVMVVAFGSALVGYWVQYDAVRIGGWMGVTDPFYVSRCKYGPEPVITDGMSFVQILLARTKYCDNKRDKPFALEIFIFGRIIVGFGGTMLPVARSYIQTLCPGREGVKFCTLLHIVPPVALILGYGLAPGLTQFSLRTPFLTAMFASGFALIFGLVLLKEVREVQSILREVPEDDWQAKLREEFQSSMRDFTETLDVKVDIKQLHTLLPPSVRVLLEPRVPAPRPPDEGRMEETRTPGKDKKGGDKKGKKGSKRGLGRGSMPSFRSPLAELGDAEDRIVARRSVYGAGPENPTVRRGTDDRNELLQVTLSVYTVLSFLVVVAQFIVEASWWGFLTALPHTLMDQHKYPVLDYSFLIVGIGFIVPFTQGFIFPFLSPRAGKHLTAVIGGFLMTATLFCATFADWHGVGKMEFKMGLVAILSPMPIGYALVKSASTALVKRYCRPPVSSSRYKDLMLAFNISSAFGAMIGSISFGGLYDEHAWYPYYVNGGWTVLACLLFLQVYTENSMLAEHKERDDEDFEVKRFAKMVTVAAHAICIPWCIIRSAIGMKMCFDSWGDTCSGVLFKVYMCISISTVALSIVPEAVIGLGFGNMVVAIVAFSIHESCYNDSWHKFIVADLCVWWAVVVMLFVFLTTSRVLRPETDPIYARFVRLVAAPVFIARAALAVFLFTNPYEWESPCFGHEGIKLYIFIAACSVFSSIKPKVFLGYTLMCFVLGTIVMFVSAQGDGPSCGGGTSKDEERYMIMFPDGLRRVYMFQFVLYDTCINLVGLGATYCVWFALLNPQEDLRNGVQVFAAYVIGIPLSLGRLLAGYLLCGSQWHYAAKNPDCKDIWVLKLYTVYSMTSFLAVRRLNYIMTHTVLLFLIGIYATTSVGGHNCGYWRTYVLVDLWGSCGVGSLVYFVWTHLKGHAMLFDPHANRFTGSLYGAHSESIRAARERGEASANAAGPDAKKKKVARPSHVMELDEETGMASIAGGGSNLALQSTRAQRKLHEARTEIKKRALIARAGGGSPGRVHARHGCGTGGMGAQGASGSWIGSGSGDHGSGRQAGGHCSGSRAGDCQGYGVGLTRSGDGSNT